MTEYKKYKYWYVQLTKVSNENYTERKLTFIFILYNDFDIVYLAQRYSGDLEVWKQAWANLNNMITLFSFKLDV